ncbi:hypothetical protein [uncultured Prevotella sp.]|jgi:hypothetical protein|uniref:hypothetical protein n=1 Tax=uncultured Prevotella sp. TaxID=159272 RepID=UPI002050B376|nr:hypothetical protein [uncultured Prevotella sp.]DAS37490.1 MAG TPA: hypothetical protein [Caudoviricetes sp.]
MNIYEQILAGLRTKFQGADDATLQRMASKKAEGVTDESKVNSIVEGISFQDVLTSYGDYRADGAQKTAVANYEKKHNIKDGKPIEEPKPQDPQPTPTPQTTEQVPAWAQSLIDSNKTLSEKLAAMDAKTKADERNQQIAAVAKSFGIPEYVYKGKQIADDVDLNQYFTDVKQEMQNGGFQFAKSPEEGNHEHKSEISSIAEQINKGTQEIVEQNKK